MCQIVRSYRFPSQSLVDFESRTHIIKINCLPRVTVSTEPVPCSMAILLSSHSCYDQNFDIQNSWMSKNGMDDKTNEGLLTNKVQFCAIYDNFAQSTTQSCCKPLSEMQIFKESPLIQHKGEIKLPVVYSLLIGKIHQGNILMVCFSSYICTYSNELYLCLHSGFYENKSLFPLAGVLNFSRI